MSVRGGSGPRRDDVTMTCGSRLCDEEEVEVTQAGLLLAEYVVRRGSVHKRDWACVRVRGEPCQNTLADLQAPPI